MTEMYTTDGAQYFGDPRQKVIGPTQDEIESLNLGISGGEPGLWKKLLDKITRPQSVPARAVLGAGAAAVVGGGGYFVARAAFEEGGPEQPRTAIVQANLQYDLDLPVAPGVTVWISDGPHSDGYSGKDDTAFDLLVSPDRIPCDDGEGIYRGEPVRAMADGEVITVGNEANEKDPYHSVVRIQHSEGLISGSMHLAGMSEFSLDVGETVTQGDPIGYVSCEIPRGGYTSGVHGHFWFEEEGGEAISLDRLVLSGWEFKAGDEAGEETVTSGREMRVPHTTRCGPPPKSTDPCGGDRNDLVWNEPGVVVPRRTATPIPTRALIPTIAPVETIEPTFEPVSPPRSSEPFGILVLDGKGDGVEIPHSESLNLTGDMTIEARIRIPEGTEDGMDTIFAKGTRSEQYALWAGFWKCGDQTVENAAAVLIGGVGRFCAENVIRGGEEWVDVAMTRSGNNIKIIADGQVILEVFANGQAKANSQNVFAGMSPVPINEDLEGQIDGIRVYNTGRTLEQITEDFENFDSMEPQDGLVLNMPYDGDVLDYSGYGNHGELLGNAHVVQ